LVLVFSELSGMRVDLFSIIKTVLSLKIRNFFSEFILGAAIHQLKFKVKTNKISLDLTFYTVHFPVMLVG
jgi:hypothetical protein